MATRKDLVDRTLTMVAAIAAAVLPILVDSHVVTSLIAADIGSGVAVLIAGYHGGSVVTSRAAAAPADQLP